MLELRAGFCCSQSVAGVNLLVADWVEVGEAHSYLHSPGHMPRAMKVDAMTKR